MNFNEEIKNGLVLVDFYASWCGPCKMLSPILEDISNNRSGIKIVKIDVDQHNDLAREYGVMSIPKMILFKNGIEVSSKLGYDSKENIEAWIESNK